MEGCRRQLIPGPIPTIRKIEPGKQFFKRQRRKGSLGLSFSAVLCHSWSFLFRRSILYVYSQTSLRIVNIFSSNSLSLVLFISPRCCILVFYPFCYSSHVACSENAGLPKSLSMVSKVFRSAVNNLLFFSQTQVSISTFHINHKWTVTFLTVTGIFIPRSWPFDNLIGFRCRLIRRPSRYARQCCERNSFSLERFAVFISVDLK